METRHQTLEDNQEGRITMTCSVEGCESPAKYKGLCGKHYKRQWRHGDPTVTKIHVWYTGEKCLVENCKSSADSKGMCKLHYQRYLRYGRTNNIKAPNGSGTETEFGYVKLTIDGKRVYEHTYLAEKALGKPLPKGAVVHHLNELPWDNHTPLNLVICPDQAYHMLLHKRARDLGLSKFWKPSDEPKT